MKFYLLHSQNKMKQTKPKTLTTPTTSTTTTTTTTKIDLERGSCCSREIMRCWASSGGQKSSSSGHSMGSVVGGNMGIRPCVEMISAIICVLKLHFGVLLCKFSLLLILLFFNIFKSYVCIFYGVNYNDMYLPLETMWPKSSSGVSPKKGTHPTKNSYNITPIDHQSTGLPVSVGVIFVRALVVFGCRYVKRFIGIVAIWWTCSQLYQLYHTNLSYQ